MSNTPRTDAACMDNPKGPSVNAEFAQQLERELAAATERIKRLERALREIASGNRTAHECVNWARQALAEGGSDDQG